MFWGWPEADLCGVLGGRAPSGIKLSFVLCQRLASIHLPSASPPPCPNWVPSLFEKQDGRLSKLYLGTLALLKRRENAAQILIFILWLGHSLEHPKVAKISSKSFKIRQKITKSCYLGWLWAPLGSPWRPLGHHLGPGRQKPSKK